MTESQAAQLILEKFGMTEAQLPKPRIVTFIPAALQELAERIASPEPNKRQGVRELLRKDFSISVISGTGSLATALVGTSGEGLLAQFARGWLVYNTGDTTLPYSYVADKGSLLLDRPRGVGYFTVDGTNLLVMTSLGTRTITATYTVRGAYVPNLTNIETTTLEIDFLNTLYELVKNGIPEASPVDDPQG